MPIGYELDSTSSERQVAFRHDKELPLFGVAVVGMFVVAPVPGKDIKVRKAVRRFDPWTSVPWPVALASRDVENRPPPDRGGFMIP
ncbi:MAG: hypothetical protein OXF88_10505 [Rhodobacteraceae bacterium]|nr:hypothetical protein [Paracoccaceae bacterium]MCY4141915.1 hypothetical protein [Paracoccaceae bacterium]